MVSSQIHNPKTEENVGDLTTEILNAKNNFDNIKMENTDLKAKLEILQKQFSKVENEKNENLELNELKM